MPQYRKRPIVVDAVQYTGHGSLAEGHSPPPMWMWAAFENGTLQPTNGSDPLMVKTLEGDLIVAPGDYIIRGVGGELYPCKPDIFAMTYEAV